MGTPWLFLNTSESDRNGRIVTIAPHTDFCFDTVCAAEERGVVRLDRWKLHLATGIGTIKDATLVGIYREEHRFARAMTPALAAAVESLRSAVVFPIRGHSYGFHGMQPEGCIFGGSSDAALTSGALSLARAS
jgi:hypothetical protein